MSMRFRVLGQVFISYTTTCMAWSNHWKGNMLSCGIASIQVHEWKQSDFTFIFMIS